MDSILGNTSQNQGTFSVDLQPLRPKSPLEQPHQETALQPELVNDLEPMPGAIANFSDLDVLTQSNTIIAPVALQSASAGDDLTGTHQQVGDASVQVFALAANEATPANNTPLNRNGVNNVVAALAQMSTGLDSIGAFNTNVPLPLASDLSNPVSLSELVDPQTVLSTLQRELQTALSEKDNVTVDDLKTFFSTRWNGTTIGDSADEALLRPTLGTIQVSSATPTITTRSGPNNTTITEVEVTFTTQRNNTFSISKAPELQDQKIEIESDVTTSLNSGMTFKATFILGSDVSLKINKFSASVDEANPSLSATTMNVGVLGVDATNGAIDLAADVDVSFAGNADGLTVAELQTPIGNLVTLNASSNLDVNFQLTPEAGITSTQSLTGTFNIGNGIDFINNSGILPVTLPANLRDFTRINPNELLQPMRLFGNWLDSLDGSSLYAKSLPFVKDVTLGQAIDLGGALRSEVTNHLQIASDQPLAGLANFDTVQDMVRTIANSGDRITANYNAATDELTLRVEVEADQASGLRPLDLNVNAGGLNSVIPAFVGDITGVSVVATNTNGTNPTTTLRVVSANHGLANATQVAIADITGIAPANGIFTIQNVTADSFEITVNGTVTTTYAGGGSLSLAQVGLKSVDPTANVAIAPSVALDFTYGIDLTAQTQAILAPTLTETRLLPQSGKLSKDAAFQVLFADGSSRLVTVLRSATDENTSLNNLRADVASALSNAGLNLQVALSNNRLTFSSPIGQAFTISVDDPTNAAVTELGLRSPITQLRADNTINLNPTASTTLTLTVGNIIKTITVDPPEGTSLIDNLNTALKVAFPSGNGSLVTAFLDTKVEPNADPTQSPTITTRLILESDRNLVVGTADAIFGFTSGQTSQLEKAASFTAAAELNTAVAGTLNEPLNFALELSSANQSTPPANQSLVNVAVNVSNGSFNSINELISRINTALRQSLAAQGFAETLVQAIAVDNRVQFQMQVNAADPFLRLHTTDANNPILTQLGFVNDQFATAALMDVNNPNAPIPVFFQEQSTIEGTVGLALNDPTAKGQFGVVALDLENISLQGAGSLVTSLKSVDGSDRISYEQLDAARVVTIVAQTSLPEQQNGHLSGDASLALKLNDAAPVTVNIPRTESITALRDIDDKRLFNPIQFKLTVGGDTYDLFIPLQQLQDQRANGGLSSPAVLRLLQAKLIEVVGDRVLVTLLENRLRFSSKNPAEALQLVGADELGFDDGQKHSIDELLIDINLAMQQAGLGDRVVAGYSEQTKSLVLGATLDQTLTIVGQGGAASQLGFQVGQTAASVVDTPVVAPVAGGDDQFTLTLPGRISGSNESVDLTVRANNFTDSVFVVLNSNSDTLLKNLTLTQVLSLLKGAGTVLEQSLKSDELANPVPLLGTTVRSLYDYSAAFAQVLRDIEQDAKFPTNGDDPTGETLQSLEQRLQAKLGTTESIFDIRDNGLFLDLNFANDAVKAIAFSVPLLDLAKDAFGANNVPTTIDLETAGLPTDDARIASTDGSEQVNVITAVNADLRLELNFSGSSSEIRVDDETEVEVSVNANKALNFNAQYDLATFDIIDGVLEVDATYTAKPNTDEVLTLFNADDLTTDVLGSAAAIMGIRYEETLDNDDVVDQFGAIDIRYDDLSNGTVSLNSDLPDLVSIIQGETRGPDGRLGGTIATRFVSGVNQVLDRIEDGILSAIDGVEIPMVGDKLRESMEPFFKTLRDIRADIEDKFERLAATDLVEAVGDLLFDVFGPDGLSILRNSTTTNSAAIGREDILTLRSDDLLTNGVPIFGNGEKFVEWNFHLGQEFTYTTPDFELGLRVGDLSLEEILPNFGFNLKSDDGITFSIQWDLHLGFGISEEEGFYINSGATTELTHSAETLPLSAQEVDELSVNITIEAGDPYNATSGLSANVALGLIQGNMTDGTPIKTQLTIDDALNPLGMQRYQANFDLNLTFLDKGIVKTLNIDNISYQSSAPETFTEFLLKLNLEVYNQITETSEGKNNIFTDSPFPAIALVPDLSKLLEGKVPLLIQARFPEIVGMELTNFKLTDGEDEVNIARQFEDGRSRTLGFSLNQSSSGGLLVAEAPPPIDGKLQEDTELRLTIDGTAIDLKLESDRSDEINSVGDLVAALNVALQRRLNEGFAPGQRPNVQVVLNDNGHIAFSSDRDLTVTFQSQERSKVEVNLGLNLVDPDFPDASGANEAIQQGLEEGDQSYFNRVSINTIFGGNLIEVFKPTLEAKGQLRLHVDAGSDHITDFVGDKLSFLGLDKGSLELPSATFDLKIDASVSAGVDEDGSFKPEYDIDGFHFDNIALDVGSLLDHLVKPVANTIGTVLDPIFNVIGSGTDKVDGFINQPLPLLDKLGFNTTLRDIASNLPGFQNLVKIYDLAKQLAQVAEGVSGFLAQYDGDPIRFGCIELVMDPDSPLYFPNTLTPVPCEVATAVDDIQNLDPVSLLNTSSQVDIEPGGLKLDILTPGAVMDLLLGQPLDLLSFNLPTVDLFLGADFGFKFKQLGFNIHAGATIKTDLGIGYDSTGLEHMVDAIQAGGVPDFNDLLDGFYIRNNVGPELSLGLSIGGGGHVGPIRTPSVNLGLFRTPAVTIFEASAQANVSGGIAFDLQDPNEDGRLRLDEILEFVGDFSKPEQLFQMFDITGGIRGGFDASITVFNQTLSTKDLPFPTNFDVGFSLQDIIGEAFGQKAAPPPKLATVITVNGERVLRINTGPYANARITGDTDDSDNPVNITGRLVDGQIEISGYGVSQRYSRDVARILVVGSRDGDTFDFSKLDLTPVPS